ncbi:hypothetical protein A2U01_0070066, partial [Trifolium medium]|nr:hypothetical protein [Trifolium medium]
IICFGYVRNLPLELDGKHKNWSCICPWRGAQTGWRKAPSAESLDVSFWLRCDAQGAWRNARSSSIYVAVFIAAE